MCRFLTNVSRFIKWIRFSPQRYNFFSVFANIFTEFLQISVILHSFTPSLLHSFTPYTLHKKNEVPWRKTYANIVPLSVRYRSIIGVILDFTPTQKPITSQRHSSHTCLYCSLCAHSWAQEQSVVFCIFLAFLRELHRLNLLLWFSRPSVGMVIVYALSQFIIKYL